MHGGIRQLVILNFQYVDTDSLCDGNALLLLQVCSCCLWSAA